jgi:heme/copper-type cytochrome/quinol oxidase subunit 3
VPELAIHRDEPAALPALDLLPPDDERGTAGMKLAILTEALLFVTLFFAYFFIGHQHASWPARPPRIDLALALLAILLASSGMLQGAESALAKGSPRLARLLLLLTVALGLLFVGVQALEYRERLHELRPTTNAYGSLFYVITAFHGLHVVAGLLMLGFVAALPQLNPRRSPHRPLHNAALYWHFVDAIWVVVVLLLYVLPRWRP